MASNPSQPSQAAHAAEVDAATHFIIQVSEQPNKRSTMEDRNFVIKFTFICPYTGAKKTFTLLAVLDGHGGHEAASYAQEHLVRFIKIELMEAKPEIDAFTIEHIYAALSTAFIKIDKKLRDDESLSLGGTGTTVVLALIDHNDDTMYIANLGDSRLVHGHKQLDVSSSTDTVVIDHATIDHKPDVPDETVRIRRAGGFVAQRRVLGELAVSRALGDFRFKELPCAANSYQESYLVSEEPTLSSSKYSEDHILIIASDGLWDVMANGEAIAIAYDAKKEGVDASKKLVDIAITKNSQDNITVIVVYF